MPAVDPAKADIDVRQYSSIAALCLIASSFNGNGSETHAITHYTKQLRLQLALGTGTQVYHFNTHYPYSGAHR